MKHLRVKEQGIPAITRRAIIKTAHIYLSGENLITFDHLNIPIDPKSTLPEQSDNKLKRRDILTWEISFGVQITLSQNWMIMKSKIYFLIALAGLFAGCRRTSWSVIAGPALDDDNFMDQQRTFALLHTVLHHWFDGYGSGYIRSAVFLPGTITE